MSSLLIPFPLLQSSPLFPSYWVKCHESWWFILLLQTRKQCRLQINQLFFYTGRNFSLLSSLLLSSLGKSFLTQFDAFSDQHSLKKFDDCNFYTIFFFVIIRLVEKGQSSRSAFSKRWRIYKRGQAGYRKLHLRYYNSSCFYYVSGKHWRKCILENICIWENRGKNVS